MSPALLVAAGLLGGDPVVAADPWQVVAPGLEVGRLLAPTPPMVGDSTILVVRVDPARYAFRLLSAKLRNRTPNPTAVEWVEREGVLGAINAGMFQADHRTPTAYMRADEGLVSGVFSKDNALFVAEPLAAGMPPAQILDRTCADWRALAARYRVAVQGIRMIDCRGRNTWVPQPRRFSTACVGADDAGRILFIHARSPWATHDLVDVLLALPLSLTRLMYVEGGPEASLHVKVGGRVVASAVGSYETGFWENDENQAFWPLPNVLAFGPR